MIEEGLCQAVSYLLSRKSAFQAGNRLVLLEVESATPVNVCVFVCSSSSSSSGNSSSKAVAVVAVVAVVVVFTVVSRWLIHYRYPSAG